MSKTNLIYKNFFSRKYIITLNNSTFIKTNVSVDKLNEILEKNTEWLKKCRFEVKSLIIDENNEILLKDGKLWVGTFYGNLDNITIIPYENDENNIELKGTFLKKIKIKLPEYDSLTYLEKHDRQIKDPEMILMNFKNYKYYDNHTIKELSLNIEKIFQKHKTSRNKYILSQTFHRNGFDNKHYIFPSSIIKGLFGYEMLHYLFPFQKIKVIFNQRFKIDIEILKVPSESNLKTIIRCLNNNKIYEFNGFINLRDIISEIIYSETKSGGYIKFNEFIVNPGIYESKSKNDTKCFIDADLNEKAIVDKLLFEFVKNLDVDFIENNYYINSLLKYNKENVLPQNAIELPLSFLYGIYDYERLHLLERNPYYSKEVWKTLNIENTFVEKFFENEINKYISDKNLISDIKKQFLYFWKNLYFVSCQIEELYKSNFIDKSIIEKIDNLEKALIYYYISLKFNISIENEETYYRIKIVNTVLNNINF